MRKHDVRKWLHAILDLLPVLVIPLFMIYSSNKNYQSTLAITQDVDRQVEFNQLSQYLDSKEINGLTITNNEHNISIQGTLNTSFAYNQCEITKPITFKRDESKYFVRFSNNDNWQIGIRGYPSHSSSFIWSDIASSSWIYSLYVQISLGQTIDLNYLTLNVYNLTEMFGRGNEPTIQEFESYFPLEYYPYNSGEKVVIDNYDTITYNDTDIGSQMFYTLYNTVDKYFNMGNVFNLNGVYDWFVFNIFSGNFSPAIYVVWQIVLYEFVMDLLFLLYGLFMWFIDMVEKIMDKPFKSIK